MPPEATNALVVTSIISITLNPLLYRGIEPLMLWLEEKGFAKKPVLASPEAPIEIYDAAYRVVVVGYGPVGQTLTRILRDNEIQVIIVETNLTTVQQLRAAGELAVYGDATNRQILHSAGVENAQGLLITARMPPQAVVRAARELNPRIRIATRATYLQESDLLVGAGADAVFASEGEIALSMTEFLLRELGATDEQIDRERHRVRTELFPRASLGAAEEEGAAA
jgi:CPA2 family monovalent cation:H+ antiporter-2